LRDVPIPRDKNVIKKEAENILKYKNPSIEVQRMWNVKCFVIRVMIWVTGIVIKGLKMSGNSTRKAVSRLSTKKKNSCTEDVAHNKESVKSEILSLSCGMHQRFKRKSNRGKETCDKR